MQFCGKRMDADGENAKIKVAFSRNGRINLPAAGSGPLTHPSGCSSGVERNLAKVDVVGSNPIIRSINTPWDSLSKFLIMLGILNKFSLRKLSQTEL